MGFFSDEDITKVRSATDLVELVGERSRMVQKGRDFWCCCPLHGEKTPSFKIDPATQLWHCFGCDEGGDAFGFIMKADELTFPEAVRKLAERAHIELDENGHEGVSKSAKQRLKDVCASTAAFYHTLLMRSRDERASAARDYLSKRGLGGNIPKEWMLGFAPGNNQLVQHLRGAGFTFDEMIAANVAVKGKNGQVRDRFYDRVIFPINDISGEVIAFGGRVIGSGNPKYLNSQETPIFHKSNVLFGLDKAKAKMASSGTAIVAEGYTDVIALHSAGITNSVATLGTALTKYHIRQLSRQAGKRIVYVFDGDAAGQRATDRALMFIDADMTPEAGRSKIELCALCLPDGQDPAEYLDGHSPDQMQALIDSAPSLLQFGIDRRIDAHDISLAEGKAKAMVEALSVLAPIKDSILAKEYAIGIASRLGLREDDVLRELAKIPVRSYGAQIERTEGVRSQEEQKPSVILSKEEQNRLALERELLGICAAEPVLALSYSDAVTSINWHSDTHRAIANALYAALAEDLLASPASLIEAAARAVPVAPSLLTKVLAHENHEASDVIVFITEELYMGDLESEIASMKAELATGEVEDGALFASLVALQSRLADIRNNHKAL